MIYGYILYNIRNNDHTLILYCSNRLIYNKIDINTDTFVEL